MERTLKAKYSTRELKEDFLDVSGMAIENRDRIKNVERCVDEFGKHIQRHGDVLDSKLNQHDYILFGEHGDDGLVSDMKDLMKLKSEIGQLKWAIIGAIVLSIIKEAIPLFS